MDGAAMFLAKAKPLTAEDAEARRGR